MALEDMKKERLAASTIIEEERIVAKRKRDKHK
jgi:hypothetical protein